MENERIILGENCLYSSDCKETGLNNNVIVCGGSGSGKTMSIAEPRLLETKNTSMIAVVTKRRIVTKYTPLLEQRGYKILDLNFAAPQRSTCSFDPLQYVKDDTDITFLAKSIVMANPNKKDSHADPFWDENATSLLSAEIAYVMMTNQNATFDDVLQFHECLKIKRQAESIETSLDREFESLEACYPGCFAISCWNSFRCLPMRTAGCVLSALNTSIDSIFTSDLREMMANKRSVDFKTLADQKTILFVTTSPVNPAIHSLVSMFYSQAFKQLFEYAENCPHGKLPIPVHVLCDDFATGSPVLNFAEYISIFREKGISVTLLLQSESQLSQLYGPENATTIINNCDSYVFLGGMDIKTAQNISMRLNAPLDEVLYMPIGQEILFRRGQRPIVTQRYYIENNELYQSVTEDYEARMEAQEMQEDMP